MPAQRASLPVSLLAGRARSIGRDPPRVSGARSAYHCSVNLSAGGGAAPRAPLAGAQRVEASVPRRGRGGRARATRPRGGVKTAPLRPGWTRALDAACAGPGLKATTARRVRRLRRTIRARSGRESTKCRDPPHSRSGAGGYTGLLALAPACEQGATKSTLTCWRTANKEQSATQRNSPNAGAGAKATWGGWRGRYPAGGPLGVKKPRPGYRSRQLRQFGSVD